MFERRYKQGKHGTVPDSMKRPTNPLDLRGRAKYDSWKRVAHLSPAEARQAYVDLLFERTESYLDDLAIKKGHKQGLFYHKRILNNSLNNNNNNNGNINATESPVTARKRHHHRHTISHPNPALLVDMPRWVSVFENYRSIVAGEKEGTSFYLDGGDSSGSEDEDEDNDDHDDEEKNTDELDDSDVEISGSEAKLNES